MHARGMGARVGAEVGGAVPWVAGHGEGRARWRPNARAGGDVRGERARPDIRLEGAKAGMKGRRVRVRGADSLGKAGVGRGEVGADEGHEVALCSRSVQLFAVKHRPVFIRGVPRLTQQSHDLALAILPGYPATVHARSCQVEGSVAVLVSERRIRATFEETLGDREVAVGCRVMQS